jgi:hypothetical protein
MAGIQDFACFTDDFFGADTFSTAGQGSPWAIADTSSSGTPTYATVTPSATGEVALTLEATSEVQNVCLSFGDKLCFDIDNIQRFEARLKVSGCTTGTTISWGLGSARNDTPASMTALALFQMVGATSTTNVYVESDDNVTDTAPVASGQTLATTYKRFVIDFAGGKSDVKFYIDGIRVAKTTTFTMAGYTGSLQPFFQIQKAANTNVDALTIDYVSVECRR